MLLLLGYLGNGSRRALASDDDVDDDVETNDGLRGAAEDAEGAYDMLNVSKFALAPGLLADLLLEELVLLADDEAVRRLRRLSTDPSIRWRPQSLVVDVVVSNVSKVELAPGLFLADLVDDIWFVDEPDRLRRSSDDHRTRWRSLARVLVADEDDWRAGMEPRREGRRRASGLGLELVAVVASYFEDDDDDDDDDECEVR